MKNKIQELVNFLNYHTKLYDEGKPEISDFEWDKVYFELQKLEQESGIVLPDSPTQKIKYEVVSALQKVEHNHPMLSAAKTKDWNDFIQYFGDHSVVGMLKLDGLTCSLRYINGKLVSAETRGNGEIGEDILHNALVIKSIPKYIDYKEELIVDGEVICRYSDFEPFSNDYANPRNFAAGSIRLLDSSECKTRNLTFIPWYVVKGLDDNLIKNFNKLVDLGFTVAPWTSSFDWDAKDFLIDIAKELGYPIDGLVGRFTSREYGESLGSTAHHSKALYAFKFSDEEYETELVDIELSIGRTGLLTPVAVFKPIEAEGTTIERASLHNLSITVDLLGLHPFIGQKIYVCKKNEIIPQITKAETDNIDWDNLIKINKCPICNSDVNIKDNDGVVTLWCGNANCDGKLINRIDHFVGKRGLDVKGLSKATIGKLIDNGWLGNLREIFSLSNFEREWKNLPGFGEASVNKILSAIETSKHTTLERFITSLGIPLIGSAVAKEIVKYYATYDDFREAIGGEWSLLDGFGPEMEKSLNNFDYTEADEIAKLLIFEDAGTSQNTDLSGTIWCITGKSSLGSRDTLKKMIEQAGGKVTSSVSAKTNYLIANAVENTTKYNTAVSLNIPIVNDEEFLKILGENN